MRSSSSQLKNSELGTHSNTVQPLDSLGRFGVTKKVSNVNHNEYRHLPNIHNVIYMIAKRYKKVKEKFTATLHFCLHGSTPLKCLATSDNQSKIMSAEARVRVWCVVISIPSTAKNHSNLDSTLQTLFPKRQALEFLETVFLCSAVYDCISQEMLLHTRYVYCSLDRSADTGVFGVWGFHCILKFVRVSTLVVHQAWVIVALLRKS